MCQNCGTQVNLQFWNCISACPSYQFTWQRRHVYVTTNKLFTESIHFFFQIRNRYYNSSRLSAVMLTMYCHLVMFHGVYQRMRTWCYLDVLDTASDIMLGIMCSKVETLVVQLSRYRCTDCSTTPLIRLLLADVGRGRKPGVLVEWCVRRWRDGFRFCRVVLWQVRSDNCARRRP